jgi:hypothetical protein
MSDDDALLTREGVAERYGIHPKSVPRMVKAGKIPGPVEGWPGQKHRWLRSEIVAHIRGMRKSELAEQVK